MCQHTKKIKDQTYCVKSKYFPQNWGPIDDIDAIYIAAVNGRGLSKFNTYIWVSAIQILRRGEFHILLRSKYKETVVPPIKMGMKTSGEAKNRMR